MFKTAVNNLFMINNINKCVKRCAGHSKWQNIRHIKAAKDAEKSKMFVKLSTQMRVAVQLGGSTDPNKNLRLEQIIDQARRFNMPNASIQNVLKSCESDKSQAKAHTVEIKGPGSCFIICELFTNNLHATRQNIAGLLRKHQSKYSDGGACKHLFEEKGMILVDFDEDITEKQDDLLEKATDDAIEAGAEDVTFIEDNLLQFICGPSNFKSVVHKLQDKYKIQSASIEFLPNSYQNLTEDEMQTFQRLMDRLNAMPEVVRLFDNVQ